MKVGTGKDYYYRLEIIKTDSAGKIDYQVSVEQVLTIKDPVLSSQKEKTGAKEYLGYYSYSTPSGNGTVESSGGNMTYTQEDAALPSSQLPFEVTRVYNSQCKQSGIFGQGWSDSLHRELTEGAGGAIYYQESDGSVYTFEKSGSAYICKESKDYTLQSEDTVEGNSVEYEEHDLSSMFIGTDEYVIEDEEETEDEVLEQEHKYTVKSKDGCLHRFNQDGQLVATVEPNGTFLVYEYRADGRLESVKNNVGKAITVTYNKEGKAETISLPDKTKLVYTYQGGKLTEMKHCSADGKDSVSYSYTYAGDVLTSVTDGKGQKYEMTYGKDKVVKVTYPNQESYHLNYQDGTTSVTKKNKDGADIYTTTVSYDTKSGKKLKEKDADGNVTEYRYEYSKNPLLVTGTTKKTEYEQLVDGKIILKEQEQKTTITYDDKENITKEVSEDGTETDYTYLKTEQATEWNCDQPTHVESTTDGTIISSEKTTYDGDGNALKETDDTDKKNVSTTENTYDATGNMTAAVTQENGITTSKDQYTYDSDGNVLNEKTQSADVKTEDTSVYDDMGRVLKSTDEKTGEVTEYKYDYLGREIQKKITLNGKTQTSTSAYDANGTLISETDTEGITTTYKYDVLNRVVERTVSKGDSITYQTSYGYEDITVQDMAGERTIKNAYVEKENYPDGSTSSEKYYDANGKVVREKADGIYKDYSYDKSGNQIGAYTNGVKAGEKAGKRTITLYDAKGRQTHTIINPVVSDHGLIVDEKKTIVQAKEYDEKDNLSKETDALGTVTKYSYDDSARITEIVQDAGKEEIVTKAEYKTDEESQQNTTIITDAAGHKSVEMTDAAGLTKRTEDTGDKAEESIATSYEYDSRGNQTKTVYESGDYRTDEYDKRNLRIVSKGFDTNDKQTLQTEYTYDDQYRQIKMVDLKLSDGAMTPYRYTYTGYDGFGRTAWTAEVNKNSGPSEEEIKAHKIHFSYDAEDKVTAVTYALSETGAVESLHFAYDSNRWLKSVHAKLKGEEEKKAVRTYEYDKLGKVAVIKEYPDFAAGSDTCIAKTYTYNEQDLVSSMVYKKGDTLLEEYAYEYDKNGNIIKKEEKNLTPKAEANQTHVTKEYTYNALGRLVKTEETDHKNKDAKTTIAYQYDKAGNRIKKTEGEEETSYTYNGLDQLLTAVTKQEDKPKHQISYEYDMNGNQIKETDAETDTIVVNEYDTENRLSKATVSQQGNSLVQENLYNGDGQRIQKKEGAQVTNYFYQDEVVSYTTGANTEEKSIQNLLGLEGNIITAEQKGNNTADAYTYFLYNKDIQGSTTSILNKNGTGELSYEYDDFGETQIHGESILQNEICYTGGIYDKSTGLYYLNARYYDPENGRFLSQDTYRGELNEPDTLHLYAYCKNDPINYVDPSGHDAIVLKSNFVSEKVGHMAVLVQNNKKWYYFSWAGEGYKTPQMGKKADPKSVKGKTVYQYINEDFKRGKGSAKYRKYIYIKGNFSKAYSYIKKVKAKKTAYKYYDIATVNCAWMAIQVLRQGEIGSSRNNKLKNMQYKSHKFYSPKYKNGIHLKKQIIPNKALEKIGKIFNTSIKKVK